MNFVKASTGSSDDSATTVVGDESLNGKLVMLKNANSGLYMDVAGGTAANGTNVQQWGASNAASYNTWKLVHAGSGYYYLYSQVGDGNTYLLDVSYGATANGTNVQIYQNTYCDAQLFKFVKNSDGTYTIRTKVSQDSSCVEVASAATSSGANVQEWKVNGATCQNWYVEEVSQSATASPSPSPSTASSATPSTSSSVTVTTTVNSWDGGYTASIDLTNKGSSTVENWSLKVKKADFDISGSWNVTVTESGEYYILTGVDWNKNISANATVSFGFGANGTYNSAYYYELTYDGGSTSSNSTTTTQPSPSPSAVQNTTSATPTIYIAGDSTVQTYRASYYPQQGWGAYLADYFNSNVTVSNHAIAGRSSKSFITQGRLDTILNSIQEGDYLLVQFAINDANYNNEERYAPVGDGSEGTYQYYIKQYVEGALAKGATPILVTTTLSLGSYSNGKFVNSYTAYCQAMKDIANEYNITCVDLNTLMVNHLNSIGYDSAYYYYMISSSDTSTDKTHFTETGASAVASLVASGIRTSGNTLASFLK